VPLRYVCIPVLNLSLEGQHESLCLRSGITSIGLHYCFELHKELFGVVVTVVLRQSVGVETTGPRRALELD
jgi:hypothetical protein